MSEHHGAVVPADPSDARAGTDVLVAVRATLRQGGPAERRLAGLMLQDPAGCAAKTIAALAKTASVSQATVVRYAKSLGMAGYPELRLSLAAAHAAQHVRAVGPSIEEPVTARDSLATIVGKVGHADSRAIVDTTENLDLDTLAVVVDSLVRAGRIDIYGFGGSSVVAADLQLKLHRIGRISFAWVDHDNALHSAGLLARGDVAVGVSHSGATRATVDALARARACGATTVALTNFPKSPVARAADLVLTTAARETDLRSGAVGSRSAALAVVDCLFVAVAQRNLPAVHRALGRGSDRVTS